MQILIVEQKFSKFNLDSSKFDFNINSGKTKEIQPCQHSYTRNNAESCIYPAKMYHTAVLLEVRTTMEAKHYS